MRVRVTRKLAECVDGVDLSRCREGDVIDLTEPEAQLIIAEQWAVPARRASDFATPTPIEAIPTWITGCERNGSRSISNAATPNDARPITAHLLRRPKINHVGWSIK